MNKETELYLIQRVEELSARCAILGKENETLSGYGTPLPKEDFVAEYHGYDLETLKRQSALFDVLKGFLYVKCDPITNEQKLVFLLPELELNTELADMFLEALYNGEHK